MFCQSPIGNTSLAFYFNCFISFRFYITVQLYTVAVVDTDVINGAWVGHNLLQREQSLIYTSKLTSLRFNYLRLKLILVAKNWRLN